MKADMEAGYVCQAAIVEDEPIENEAMKQFIQGMFPEVEVIWQAENGVEALEQIRRQPPELLIVDIEMPVMNGLELCEKLYQENYGGVILINTAFDKFSYTRKAIQLKVFDYILKPSSDEELYEAVFNGIKEAKRRRLRRAPAKEYEQLEQYTFSMVRSRAQEEGVVERFLQLAGWPAETGLQTCMIRAEFSGSLGRTILPWMEKLVAFLREIPLLVVSDYIGEQMWTALLQPEDRTDPSVWYTLMWCVADLIRARDPGAYIEVNPYGSSYREIAGELALLEEPANDKTEGNGGMIRQPGSISMPKRTWAGIRRSEAEYYGNLLKRYFREQNTTRILTHVRTVREQTGSYKEAVGMELAWVIIKAAKDVWPSGDFSEEERRLLKNQGSVYPWIEAFADRCSRLKLPEAGDIISVVSGWMEKEFGENLTQSVAAERLGMDPAAFSRFYKKKTGRNFSEALTEIRMKHAVKLLEQNPGLTLEELCAACGLSSRSYFSEVFKKWQGMTITQFLEKLKK